MQTRLQPSPQQFNSSSPGCLVRKTTRGRDSCFLFLSKRSRSDCFLIVRHFPDYGSLSLCRALLSAAIPVASPCLPVPAELLPAPAGTGSFKTEMCS